MTPLNIILANSRIAVKRFIEVQKYLDEYVEMIQNPSLKKEVGDKNTETIKIIQAIEQSG